MKFMMFQLLSLLLAGAAVLPSCQKVEQGKVAEEAAILVFSKTAGFRHKSIEAGITAIKELAQEHQVQVTATEDAAYFVADSLKQYKAVVFLNTTGDVLNQAQEQAFEQYIQAGGGFAGIHAASDTEFEWPWFNKLVGAYFLDHPAVQPAAIDVLNKNHTSTSHLPDRWERTDEWYNFKSMNPDVQVLANLDEQTYKGGKNGDQHPIAWYHTFDGGRAFYTALGHTNESYAEPLFRQHMWGGIRYAMGE
ncbi:ThuA domain-containing protein [Pontibacter beigongshangensis]|uniref:ThuA domain-containing protein n=1 Tax=Pontibacter beigongshangensis TaxID=2574733 RepID=UPI00164FD9C5|nr:ThuA domain-containing protein [Pontibacter beigongshangensis]